MYISFRKSRMTGLRCMGRTSNGEIKVSSSLFLEFRNTISVIETEDISCYKAFQRVHQTESHSKNILRPDSSVYLRNLMNYELTSTLMHKSESKGQACECCFGVAVIVTPLYCPNTVSSKTSSSRTSRGPQCPQRRGQPLYSRFLYGTVQFYVIAIQLTRLLGRWHGRDLCGPPVLSNRHH